MAVKTFRCLMLSSSQLNLWILFWGGVSLIAIMELFKKVRAHNLKLVLVGTEERTITMITLDQKNT